MTVFGGRACPGDAAVPPGDPARVDIAVVERGVCTFTEKVASVETAGGYDAVFVFNRTGSDGCEAALGMTVAGSLPAFGVAPRSQGYAIFDAAYDEAACLRDTTGQPAPVQLGATGDTLTFSSYFDGWGYVHLFDRATMDPDLAYLSYYAGGLRVIDISSGQIEEVGAFIDEGGNNFWCVEVFEQDGQVYVALSDRDFGLYILKATP